MDEWMKRLTADGFAELEGLEVTGTLPVRQDLINEILTTLLQNAQSGSSAQTTNAAQTLGTMQADNAAPATKPAAPKNAAAWIALVRKLQVRFQEGRAVIDFELRR